MKRTIVLLLAIVMIAALILACGPSDEWLKRQSEHLERQRQGLPTWMPTVEVTATPAAVASMAWGG